jgi:lambda repressor-like predicted transcriptional regulator
LIHINTHDTRADMKQKSVPRIPRKSGWSPNQIKAALILADIEPSEIAKTSGMSHQAILAAVRGDRCGSRSRQAIANALGILVTTIWPDALLPMRERRLRKAS